MQCDQCSRLSSFLQSLKSKYPDYHAQPVAAFGDEYPEILIVGLAPGMHGANRTGRPFTGDYAGILLYRTLYKYGLATKPESLTADDELLIASMSYYQRSQMLATGKQAAAPGNSAMQSIFAV